MAEENVGAVRQLLQDMIAPSLGSLSERVTSLSNDCLRLGESIKSNVDEIKDIWKAIGDLKEKVARMDGRVENITEEVSLKMQLELTKWLHSKNRLFGKTCG